MKMTLVLLFFVLLGSRVLGSEPSALRHQIVEQFFGSSPTGYAILRTHMETTEEGAGKRCRTWLDEYAKTPVPLSGCDTEEEMISRGACVSKLERSTLLEDGRASTRKSDDSASQESIPSLVELLRRYPNRVLIPWPAEKFGDVEHGANGYVFFYKNQTLVSGQALRAKMGAEDAGDAALPRLIGKVRLESIVEDDNCTYLTVSASTGERWQSRVFCALPRLTKNLKALESREELYLCAGRLETKRQALRTASLLRERLEGETAFSGSKVEVWKFGSTAYSRNFYNVVLTRSMDLIRDRKVENLKELSGMDFFPLPGGPLSVRIDDEP